MKMSRLAGALRVRLMRRNEVSRTLRLQRQPLRTHPAPLGIARLQSDSRQQTALSRVTPEDTAPNGTQ